MYLRDLWLDAFMRSWQNSIMILDKLPFLARAAYKFQKLIYEYLLIRNSELFDKSWYLEKNPDVAQAKVNPLIHYLRYGGFEGRDPNPGFSSKWYLDTYKDVKKTKVNPLLHFLRYGKKEGRKTYPSQTLIWPPLDLSKISWENIQFDPIVVHSMGKVGSQTIRVSLIKAFEELGIPAPVYFTH